MKTLSIAEAEHLCVLYLSKLKDKEQADFLMWHSKVVGECAIFLAESRKNKNLDLETLRIAAFVHDIGYFADAESHEEHSLRLLSEDGFEISPILRDCILNHGSNALPETEEGKIMQIADKLSFFHPYTLELLLKYNPERVKSHWIDFYRTSAEKAVNVMKLID